MNLTTKPSRPARPGAGQQAIHMSRNHRSNRTHSGGGNGKMQGFSLAAPTASSVHLVGDFTGWQQRPIPMEKDPRGNWRTAVELTPGEHQYQFLVDGQWQGDPECARHAENPYGGQNCVCLVH